MFAFKICTRNNYIKNKQEPDKTVNAALKHEYMKTHNSTNCSSTHSNKTVMQCSFSSLWHAVTARVLRRYKQMDKCTSRQGRYKTSRHNIVCSQKDTINSTSPITQISYDNILCDQNCNDTCCNNTHLTQYVSANLADIALRNLKEIHINVIKTQQGDSIGNVKSKHKSMHKVRTFLKVAHIWCVFPCFELHPSCLEQETI